MPLRPTRNLAQPFNQRLQLQQQSPRNMQSNSSKFKKAFRSVFPASSTAVTPTLSTRLDPASSEQIGGCPTLALVAVETSLAAMKEASALVAKIPWFSPVAGLILQALTMREARGEAIQEEWDVVMGRLESIARLVNNVGVACKRYNVEEEDLPDGLREIFQSLETYVYIPDIVIAADGTSGNWAESRVLSIKTRIGGIKKMFLRKDLLRKVQQYDAKLLNVLQSFTPHYGWALCQLAEGPVIDASRATVPQIFFGRDSELAEIVHMIFAILALVPPVLRSLDPDGDTRNSVEELLSRVTGLWCLTVLITMRGTVRPGQTQWTIPLLPPLMTLDHDSAKSLWVHTADNYDAFAEELIKSVDYVPLAVTLLAHLAEATSPEILLKQWHKKNTQFIHTSQANKLSNLEHSIQISMDSGRMRAVPSAKEMLGVLKKCIPSLLIGCLKEWGTLHSKAGNFESAKYKLKEAEDLCEHSEENESSLHANILLVLGEIYLLQDTLHEAEVLYRKALDIHKHINDAIGQGNDYLGLGGIYLRLNKITEAKASYQKALDFFSLTEDPLSQGNAYFGLGKTYFSLRKLTEAEVILQKALEFHKAANSIDSQGNDYIRLGDIYNQLNKPSEAEASFQKALKCHKLANNVLGQGNGHEGLGTTYLQSKMLDMAEASYKKALECYSLIKDVLGQGNALQKLGRVQMEKSQIQEAKSLFENALDMHKQAQDPVGQETDKRWLNKVLSKMGHPLTSLG
ncbi:hypothetical protein BC826DRAFT_1118243 [Russula brevipes]|nr:hypothetical protein BC826DRAFT_1118243 [Russula brevipes]